jgi:hypothetical protein
MKTILYLTMLWGALTALALDSAFVVGDDGLDKVMVFNRYQELVWEYPAVDPYSVQVLDNGNLLLTSSRYLLVEVNQAQETVWSYSSENEIFGAVRDGDVTIIGDCTSNQILFVESDGTIQNSFTAVSTSTGHSTMRNITLTSDDTLLVAHLGDHTVREYSRSGTLLAEFAVSGSAYRGVRLDNGHTLVGHELGITEFDEDGSEIWDIDTDDIPDAGLSFGTAAYRLDDGNTMMCNWFGHGGDGEPLFEIDAETTNIVWTMDDGVLDSPLAFIPVSDAWAASYSIEQADAVEIDGLNDSILFVYRQQYVQDHHNTATFFPACTNEYNTGYYTPGAALKVFDPESGSVTTLLETSEGMIRDPDVYFDATKIVFSMRQSEDDSYHIYEINADGSGLVQLTTLDGVDDLDPIYMPDGDIVFVSTREMKYIGCNRQISANLHRMDSDGANIIQIARSTLFEDHPSLMPDGRIMYSRWEYVDRNFGDAQGLWTCDPDGTEHVIYYGNNTTSPGGVLDGQAVPGTPYTICTFSSCHDVPWGAIALIDRRLGVDGADPVVRTWPEGLESWVKTAGQDYDKFKNTSIMHEDPWPLLDSDTGVGGQYFLCSRQVSGRHMAIYLLDTEGESTLVYEEGEDWWGCFDPMPLAERTIPLDMNVYRSYDGADGRFYIQDVYEGTNMEGVEDGEVKYLRVIEAPNKTDFVWDKQWGAQGRTSPGMNWHNFQNKKILGTVPVEEDGSAHFNVPSSTFLYFQLLDENKMMIQSMRSGTIIQPSENQGCIGCHDQRTLAPAAYGTSELPTASMRDPDQLDGWYGEARNFGYLTEVQPVFDAHCLGCHDFDGVASDTLILAGDKTLFFNASYTELNNKDYTGRIGAGPAAIQDAKSWGSHDSALMAQILTGHETCSDLSTEEFERIATWLDLNSPYYPHFSSNYPDNLAGRAPLTDAQVSSLYALTGYNFATYYKYTTNPGPMICFDRPEKSPCLDGMTVGSDDYIDAVAIIQAGQDALAALPRADMTNFYKATTLDLWHEATWTDRRNREALSQLAIAEGLKVYDSQPLILTANKGAEGIDGVSALVSGEVLYCVSNTVVDVTVCWGSYDGGDVIEDWQYSTDLPSRSKGDFSVTLTGLVPGADIYFRVFVSNEDGTVAAYESTVFDTRSLIDADNDGMADDWETSHFGSSTSELASGDWDGDGLTNEEEYYAGTDPTNAVSCLVIEDFAIDGTDLFIAWQSAENAEYTLEYSTNLTVNTWVPMIVDRSATPPQNIYATNAPSAEVRYYRVRGQRTDR